MHVSKLLPALLVCLCYQNFSLWSSGAQMLAIQVIFPISVKCINIFLFIKCQNKG